jgi:hypothetical protein
MKFLALALAIPFLILTQDAQAQDFYAVAGWDSEGFDYTKTHNDNLEAQKKKCAADERCAGFNTNGWLKTGFRPRSQWRKTKDKSFVTYVKNTTNIPADRDVRFYEEYRGYDATGDTLSFQRNRNLVDLRTFCDNEPECDGFNSAGWLKKNVKLQAKWSFNPDNNQAFYFKGKYAEKKSSLSA